MKQGFLLAWPLFSNKGINRSGASITVAEKFLNSPNVIVVFKQNVVVDPVAIGAAAVMARAERLPELIEEFGGRRVGRSGKKCIDEDNGLGHSLKPFGHGALNSVISLASRFVKVEKKGGVN